MFSGVNFSHQNKPAATVIVNPALLGVAQPAAAVAPRGGGGPPLMHTHGHAGGHRGGQGGGRGRNGNRGGRGGGGRGGFRGRGGRGGHPGVPAALAQPQQKPVGRFIIPGVNAPPNTVVPHVPTQPPMNPTMMNRVPRVHTHVGNRGRGPMGPRAPMVSPTITGGVPAMGGGGMPTMGMGHMGMRMPRVGGGMPMQRMAPAVPMGPPSQMPGHHGFTAPMRRMPRGRGQRGGRGGGGRGRGARGGGPQRGRGVQTLRGRSARGGQRGGRGGQRGRGGRGGRGRGGRGAKRQRDNSAKKNTHNGVANKQHKRQKMMKNGKYKAAGGRGGGLTKAEEKKIDTYMSRICVSNDPDEIAKYIAQRKKRFPKAAAGGKANADADTNMNDGDAEEVSVVEEVDLTSKPGQEENPEGQEAVEDGAEDQKQFDEDEDEDDEDEDDADFDESAGGADADDEMTGNESAASASMANDQWNSPAEPPNGHAASSSGVDGEDSNEADDELSSASGGFSASEDSQTAREGDSSSSSTSSTSRRARSGHLSSVPGAQRPSSLLAKLGL